MELALKTPFHCGNLPLPAPPLAPPSPKEAELRGTRVDVQHLGRKVRLEVNGWTVGRFSDLGGRAPKVASRWFN